MTKTRVAGMRLLVTGGVGFLGQHVVREAAAQGITTFSFDRNTAQLPTPPEVEFYQGELNDGSRLARVLAEGHITTVIHTAGVSHPNIASSAPRAAFEANVLGTVTLLEAAKDAGVRRVVICSSEAAYGDVTADIVTESEPLRPKSPYGITKAAVDMMAGVWQTQYGVDAVALRFSEIYGPGNRMPQILTDIIRAGLRGEPYFDAAGADQTYQFLHVFDAARAALLTAQAGELAIAAYNISANETTTLRVAAELIANLLPTASITIGGGTIPTNLQLAPFDLTAAERDLNFTPQWSIQRGITHYVAWLRGNEY